MVSTLMLGVPWQDCVRLKSYPNLPWHVLKTWCLCSMEKIKDSKVKCAILDHFHMVMFMSINPNGTIDDFKSCGREMVVENFDNL